MNLRQKAKKLKQENKLLKTQLVCSTVTYTYGQNLNKYKTYFRISFMDEPYADDIFIRKKLAEELAPILPVEKDVDYEHRITTYSADVYLP